MKRILCLLLTVVLLLGASVGCSQSSEDAYKAKNEIWTYQKIDPEKTQIIVSRTGNIPAEQLCSAFEQKNPDIQVIYLDITGGNSDYMPLPDWLEKGIVPDIVMSASGFFNTELSLKHFENLSADPIIKNYETAALERTAVDSNIYWLPGPSNISSMMYNKTLFDEYGWEVPVTFDEFVALCDRIREDTDGEIEAWNPNAKYSDELLTALEAMTYEELFGGLENRSWYNELTSGEGRHGSHLQPYFDVLQTLIDHGILREEHFSYSATTRGNEFAEGKIAMINFNIYDADNENYDFAFMPFPTTKGDLGYLCDSYSCYVGVAVKEHTEAEADAVRRFIEYFSSADGQNAYIGRSMKVSNVKGVSMNQTDDLAALQPAVEAGHLFGLLSFMDERFGRSKFDLYQLAKDMAAGVMTAEECMESIESSLSSDEAPAETEPPEVIANVPENMTMLETSFYMADAYRAATGADIGLITHGEVYRGNMMRFFAGDINEKMVTVFKPRSFANDSTLVKVSMTGQQLLDALNDPVGNDMTANCIYAYSGLKCEVAPWNELGSKYLSVKLSDGKQIEPDRLYTVGMWSGTVFDEHITETLATYEGTWDELMIAQIKAAGTVSATDDKRIKLVWD